MKKLLLLLIALVALTTTANAQSQIATLSHNGELTSFYGATGLKNAHAQAVAGDVITLSAGFFDAVDITKAVTIRGTSMGIAGKDSVEYEPTFIVGNFNIEVSDSTHTFTLESVVNESIIRLYTINAQFIKCNFYTVYLYKLDQTSFIHCHTANTFSTNVNPETYTKNFNCISCYFKGVDFHTATKVYTTNCVLEGLYQYKNGTTYNYDLINTYITNCILINTSSSTANSHITYNKVVHYTLWVGNYSGNSPFAQEVGVDKHNSVFSGTKDNLFVKDSFCVLTDAAKKYLGNDGTELGIYGGSLPFDSTPTTPQITKFKVAPKTTADGKLSVDIEVKQPY